MNKNELVGRPTTDPKIYENPEKEGSKTASFMLAVRREYRRDSDPEADFLPIIAFGKVANSIDKNVKKGNLIGIIGRLQNNNYQKDGKTVYGYQVVAESVEFYGRTKSTDEDQDESDFHSLDNPDQAPFQS